MRQAYTEELEQVRLQVEVMGIRAEENLDRMRRVLATGDQRLAAEGIAADDDIDDMNVSLTERCYDLLCREAPVASDLRFVVSVVRILNELERVGDLALRVMKLAPHQPMIASRPATFSVLVQMAEIADLRFRDALRAWAEEDLELATELASGSPAMAEAHGRLTTELLSIDGEDAVALAVRTAVAGHAIERISDHASVIGARVRYLITGEPSHLAAEVRSPRPGASGD